MSTNHFLNMIKHLRQHEEVILHNDILNISVKDGEEVIEFLENEFSIECYDYSENCPSFNGDAALWAAKTIYTASQLLLYRQHKEADLSALFPMHEAPQDPSRILSADLCLRFLPDIVTQLKLIDGDDPLISILEDKLYRWPFSAVNYPLPVDKLDLEKHTADKCLSQLFADRIILNKNILLARHPLFNPLITANLGIYAGEWWKDAAAEIV